MAREQTTAQKRDTGPSLSNEKQSSSHLSLKKDKEISSLKPQPLDSLKGIQLAAAKLPPDPGKSAVHSSQQHIKRKVDLSRFGTMIFPEKGYQCSNLSPEAARHYYQIYINGMGSEFKYAREQAQAKANNTGQPVMLLYNESEDKATDIIKSIGSAISSRLGAAGEETVGQLEEILWSLHQHYSDKEGKGYPDQLLIRVHGYSEGALIARNATTRFFRDFCKEANLGSELAYKIGGHIEIDTSGVGSMNFREEISKVRAHVHDLDPVAWLTWSASIAKKPYYYARGEKRQSPDSKVRDLRGDHAHAVYNRELPEAFVEQDARSRAVAEFLTDVQQGRMSDSRATEMLRAAIASDEDDAVVFIAEGLEQGGFPVEGSSEIRINNYVVPSKVAQGLRARYAAGFVERLIGKPAELCAAVKSVLEGDGHSLSLKKQILNEANQREDDFSEELEQLIPRSNLWSDSPIKLGSVTLSEQFSDKMRKISAKRFLKTQRKHYWSWGLRHLDYDDFAQKLCQELLSESNSDRMKTQLLDQAFDLVRDKKLISAIKLVGKYSADGANFSLNANNHTASFPMAQRTSQALN